MDFPRSPEELFLTLKELSGGRIVSLALTANRSRILSARPSPGCPGGLDLRLQACFLLAEPEVLKEVARFASGELRGARRRRALAVLRRHFEVHGASVGKGTSPPRRRAPPLRTHGRAVDLEDLRGALNEEYFEGRVDAAITWGRALGRRRRRAALRQTLRLGSYDGEKNLIRIHRALDDPQVPIPVVETVVYHEMLHADIPPLLVRGRRYSHTPEFRRRERLHPSHSFAQGWLEEHLPYLLSARYSPC